MAKGLSWRSGFYLLVAAYLVADMAVIHGPLYQRLIGGQPRWGSAERSAVAATVYGQPITRLMLEQTMRDDLWRRGETWGKLSPSAQSQSRTRVLEQMVNERLIHAHRMMTGRLALSNGEATREELQRFIQQFEHEGGYAARRGLRHLSEAQLYATMREALEDEAWLEEKIAPGLADVDEKAARAWLADNGEAMVQPERWRAAHLFLSNHNPVKDEAGRVIGEQDRESEIKALQGELMTGHTTFEALVEKASDDARTRHAGGDLQWFSEVRMPGEFIQAVRKLRVGEVSAPVKTKLGWHLIRLLEHKPAIANTSAEADTESISEVLVMLKNQRREAAVQELIGELREQAAKGAGHVQRFTAVIAQAVPQ